jgi:hypothetical protein
MANANFSDDIPLLPLHPTISAVSDFESEKGSVFKQRQSDPWDLANTMKDVDKTQGHGHLVVTRPVSLDDVETLRGDSGTIMQADEEKQLGVFHRLTRTLWKWGIETHGYVLYR